MHKLKDCEAKAHAIPLAKMFFTGGEDTHGPGEKNGPKEDPPKTVRRKHRNPTTEQVWQNNLRTAKEPLHKLGPHCFEIRWETCA